LPLQGYLFCDNISKNKNIKKEKRKCLEHQWTIYIMGPPTISKSPIIEFWHVLKLS